MKASKSNSNMEGIGRGRGNSETLNSLIADLTCEDVIKCQNARRRLVAMGPEAVPSLVKALRSKKQWVRWEAAKALGNIGGPAATRALVGALKDETFDVRWLAAEGLIAIGRRALVPLLEELVKRPDSLWLQQGAHHVLHDMDRGDLNKALRPIMGALESAEPAIEVPLAAKAALDAVLAANVSQRSIRG